MHGFHQGILKIAMEPSFLGSAVMEGGPNRKIKLDRSPGVDEVKHLFKICTVTFCICTHFNFFFFLIILDLVLVYGI